MTFTGYLKDRYNTILLNIICGFFLFLFLHGLGIGFGELLLIAVFWIIILLFYFLANYYILKKHFDELGDTIKKLDKKYLLTEVMKHPRTVEGRQYYKLLKASHKSMMEHVTRLETEQADYKEYVEQWVHEIKAPIASAKLICENNKEQATRKIMGQLERIDHEVERTLYFARAGNVAADYIIKEYQLQPIVASVISRNKQLLIQNGVQIELDNLDYIVATDSKWIAFILNQIIINSIQYKSETPLITLSAEPLASGIALNITDNGIGIRENEIGRIFQKGFTGTNGRTNAKSTGIGLYLCKKLCDKLGIYLEVASAEGHYTTFRLIFPENRFLSKM